MGYFSKTTHLFITGLFGLLLFYAPIGFAQQEAHAKLCSSGERLCLLKQMENIAADIDNKNWRDQTYREISKTYATDNLVDDAIRVLKKITTPDTKALTIRGIGMAVAEHYPALDHAPTFKKLRVEAETISHPPSYAIALTYIAMAQAFALDNEGAWKTASDMDNDALRNKAFGETAEIQAEQGDFDAAMHSISQIKSESFRNKAYRIVSVIFSDNGLYDAAMNAATNNTNAYQRAQALQYMLDKQKPREVERK